MAVEDHSCFSLGACDCNWTELELGKRLARDSAFIENLMKLAEQEV